MNTAPFSNWDDATDLVPWGADSFGVWLFLIVAVIAFFAVIIRAVQHENACMVHIVDETHAAEEVAEVPEREEAVA